MFVFRGLTHATRNQRAPNTHCLPRSHFKPVTVTTYRPPPPRGTPPPRANKTNERNTGGTGGPAFSFNTHVQASQPVTRLVFVFVPRPRSGKTNQTIYVRIGKTSW